MKIIFSYKNKILETVKNAQLVPREREIVAINNKNYFVIEVVWDFKNKIVVCELL